MGRTDARFNPFGDDPLDRNHFIKWVRLNLNSKSSQLLDEEKLDLIQELQTSLDILSDFLDSNLENSQSSYSHEFLDQALPIWDKFKSLMEEEISWGIWRTEQEREFFHGYSDKHLKTELREKSVTSKTYYSDVPDELILDCMPVTQNGNTFYVVKSTVSSINAACSVPSFDKTLPSIESGMRVLDRERGPSEWQRNPDPHRVVAIESFISSSESVIANTPLVYCANSDYVNYETDENGLIEKLKIDFSFLKKQKDGTFCDHDNLLDLRPLWLIDGQHRIRGISQNPISVKTEIAFIFFPEDLGISAAAKIFAEVNTLARDLSDLHKMFMRHRFQLSSVEGDKDYRDFSRGLPEERNSRMNSLSYECAAYLASSPNSPLRELIKILDENPEDNHIIDAKMFCKNSRQWFNDSGPYGIKLDISREQIFKEVENYFLALESIVNHIPNHIKDWGDGQNRWTRMPPRIGKNVLQNTRCFRAFLRLLPAAMLKCSGEERPLSQELFEKVLQPISWIDWNDQDLNSAYAKKTGEQWWKCLLIWLENAIKNGETYSKSEVMTDNLNSLAGRGILSPPKKPIICLEEGSPEWPSPGEDVVVSSLIPLNSMSTATWNLRDNQRSVRNDKGKKKFKAGLNGKSIFTIKHKRWMDDTESGKQLEINVDWMNANGERGARLILKNPTN